MLSFTERVCVCASARGVRKPPGRGRRSGHRQSRIDTRRARAPASAGSDPASRRRRRAGKTTSPGRIFTARSADAFPVVRLSPLFPFLPVPDLSRPLYFVFAFFLHPSTQIAI